MTKGLRNENQELVDHSLNSAPLCKHITQHKSSQIYQSGKKNCKFTETYLFKLYLWKHDGEAIYNNPGTCTFVDPCCLCS